MCIYKIFVRLTWPAHYYVGRYAIMIACVHTVINAFMYLIFFPSDNVNSHMCRLPRKLISCIFFFLLCKTTRPLGIIWYVPILGEMEKHASKFSQTIIFPIFQNWNHKCSIKGLISHWVLTRFTCEFCLIDDQEMHGCLCQTFSNSIILNYLQLRESWLKYRLSLILPFP